MNNSIENENCNENKVDSKKYKNQFITKILIKFEEINSSKNIIRNKNDLKSNDHLMKNNTENENYILTIKLDFFNAESYLNKEIENCLKFVLKISDIIEIFESLEKERKEFLIINESENSLILDNNKINFMLNNTSNSILENESYDFIEVFKEIIDFFLSAIIIFLMSLILTFKENELAFNTYNSKTCDNLYEFDFIFIDE